MGTAFPQYAAPLVVAAAEDLSEPPVYAYNYGVADDYSGAAFSQSEQRDGYATSGSYTVNLPDGRIQTVNYVDNGDGVTQDVSYSGTPSYGPAPLAVAHAAPVLTHAVHAAPTLSTLLSSPTLSTPPLSLLTVVSLLLTLLQSSPTLLLTLLSSAKHHHGEECEGP